MENFPDNQMELFPVLEPAPAPDPMSRLQLLSEVSLQYSMGGTSEVDCDQLYAPVIRFPVVLPPPPPPPPAPASVDFATVHKPFPIFPPSNEVKKQEVKSTNLSTTTLPDEDTFDEPFPRPTPGQERCWCCRVKKRHTSSWCKVCYPMFVIRKETPRVNKKLWERVKATESVKNIVEATMIHLPLDLLPDEWDVGVINDFLSKQLEIFLAKLKVKSAKKSHSMMKLVDSTSSPTQ